MSHEGLKKVLVINYYWPPAGGPGVQRVLKFVRYLPAFGWQPVVLTVKNGEFPARDESLLQEVPAGLSVHQTATIEPYALYHLLVQRGKKQEIPTFVLTEEGGGNPWKKLAQFLRGNLFIPDARIGWIPFAVREGRRLIRRENIQLIFSSSPPQTDNLIARQLARHSGLPWVADFRDPWTDVFYYHTLRRTALAVKLDRRLEKKVLQSAHAVVTVSPSIARLLQTKAPNRYFVLPNGFDEADFPEPPSAADDSTFRLVHTGHLAGNQNPRVLWEALQQLCTEEPEFRERLQLDFYGSVHSGIEQALEETGLRSRTRFHAYLPHRQVVRRMQEAAVLFLVIPECSYSRGILTSKLFDYLGARRPILGIGPSEGDAAAILQETGAGKMYNDRDLAGIKAFLQRLFRYWLKHRSTPLTDARRIAPYSRRNLTARLANIFQEVLEHG